MTGPLNRLGQRALDIARQLTLPLFPAEPAPGAGVTPEGITPTPAVPPPPGGRTPRGTGRARRQVRLGNDEVDYELRRSARRTIGFVIDDRGLTVTAPRWVTLAEIELALHEKSGWIARKRTEWREHAERRERLAIRWDDGAPVPVLGDTLTLVILDGSPGRVRRDGTRLLVPPGPRGDPSTRDRVQPWLKEQARNYFAARIPVYAARLGRTPSSWTLSSARTRWGTCTADGAIRLNWRLVHFPPPIVDYVIAHELAHLCELNHGPRFWAQVRSLYPDCEAARQWLRAYPDDLTD